MREKISLDIPPVVEYEGENWNVGKVDHMNNAITIWRNIRLIRKGFEHYDIETRIVNSSDLYKADTKCMASRTVREFGVR